MQRITKLKWKLSQDILLVVVVHAFLKNYSKF